MGDGAQTERQASERTGGDSAQGSAETGGGERRAAGDPGQAGASGDGTSAQGETSGQEGTAGEWPTGAGGQRADGRAGSSATEDAFERSLGEYDEIMGAEQEAVARSEGGRAADEAFRQGAATTGAGETASTDQETPAGTGGRGAEQSASESAGSEGGDAMATTEAPTVQGCADADRVARQLCEAATKEEDPFLRAALWEEYNEYRKILARQ